ncbi:MAG: DedA family protein, partial [Methylococcales bacterium]|nr:DedA family protein [Methylococcales bacterium]
MQDIGFEIGGLFLSAFISSTIAPGGSEAVLAYMIAAGHYPTELVVIVATIGNTLGAVTTWGLGVLAAKKFP